MFFELRNYDRGYRERVADRDNTALLFRMVTPSDKERLVAGGEGSPEDCRESRFFMPRDGLTERELQFFTETDGFDHFAIGAVELDEGEREGRGIAIARFVRCAERPSTAKVAISVVDDMQGKGIGRMLLERLVEAARERGVGRFRVQLTIDNEKALALGSAICPSIELMANGDVITAEASLENTGTGDLAELFGALRLVAGRTAQLPL